jgi:hypothetical protein
MGLIRDVYDRVRDLSGKDGAGKADIDSFNTSFNQVAIEIFEYFIEDFKRTKKRSDLLRNHIIPLETTILPGGIVNYPVGYAHTSSCSYVKDGGMYEMREVDTSELATTLSSQIRRPNLTKNHLIYVLYDKIQIYPKVVTGTVLLNYFKTPAKAEIKFSISNTADGPIEVYNPATIESEFPINALNYFVYGILRNLGMEIKDPSLVNYALTPKNDGVLNAEE